MLTVGDRFPEFDLQAVVSLEKGKEFEQITDKSYPGKWQVLFFWPMDFTFVCPTEIAEFGKRNGDFADRDAQVLGASTDTHFVHLAWRNDHADLKDLPFPMLADTKRELSTALGILHKQDGVALRATFIVDPEGVIRCASASTTSRSAATSTRCCGCSTRCRPTSSARATGRRASPRSRWRRSHERARAAARRDSRRGPDIKLNLQAVLQGERARRPRSAGAWRSPAAVAARNPQLREAVLARRRDREVGAAWSRTRSAAAALMAMNNVYYRFRHMVGKPAYAQKPARLRMNRLVQPATNKVDFELFSLAVSAINGCEMCVRAHEKVVIEGGLTEEHVHDAVRIAATIHAAAVALEAGESGAGAPAVIEVSVQGA